MTDFIIREGMITTVEIAITEIIIHSGTTIEETKDTRPNINHEKRFTHDNIAGTKTGTEFKKKSPNQIEGEAEGGTGGTKTDHLLRKDQ